MNCSALLYGVPRNIDVRLLHYRADLVRRPPATWDALLEEVIAGHVLVPPKFARYPLVEDVLWHAVQRAIAGELDIDQALADMTCQIERSVRGE